MKQSFDPTRVVADARQQVMQGMQEWRHSAETQQAMRDKPQSYDAVVAFQAKAFATATDQDWLTWAATYHRQGARMLAVEMAMVGEKIP